MGVYTKTGDKGQTSLYTGERVDKNSLRVETYGSIDEVGSALAMVRAFAPKEAVREKVLALLKKLPLLMADIASIGEQPTITREDSEMLEKDIDAIDAKLPKLNHFLIPGDTQAGAMLDLARTTVKRCVKDHELPCAAPSDASAPWRKKTTSMKKTESSSTVSPTTASC